MAPTSAYLAARVVTDRGERTSCAVVVRDGRIDAIVAPERLPRHCSVIDLGDVILIPGLIDLQVNGGGDALFNDAPDRDGLRAIARAHRALGTTALLPTLITATPTVTEAAIEAVTTAVAADEPGIAGIHLEGPHLNPVRAGAHDADLMRPMRRADVARLPVPHAGMAVLVTVAPEVVEPGCISAMRDRGIIVAIGHSDAGPDEVRRAVAEGATGATHLFNAMAPIAARRPGVAGTVLDTPTMWAGLIADGNHVDDALLRLALRVKPDRCVLVSDAMPPVGGAGSAFELGGRRVHVASGACRTSDGTLAGSALHLAGAVRHCVDRLGVPLVDAVRMASLRPAQILGRGELRGAIAPGRVADLVALDPDDLGVRAVVAAGGRPEPGG